MSCPFVSGHFFSCHVRTCHVMALHVASCCIMSPLLVSGHFMPYSVISPGVMFCRVLSCCVMSCHGSRVMSRDRSPHVVSLVSYFHVLSPLFVLWHVLSSNLVLYVAPLFLSCSVLLSLLVSCHLVSCNDLPCSSYVVQYLSFFL